jgi:hypothetical protein
MHQFKQKVREPHVSQEAPVILAGWEAIGRRVMVQAKTWGPV